MQKHGIKLFNFRFFALLLVSMIVGAVFGVFLWDKFFVFYYVLGASVACALVILIFAKKRRFLYLVLILGFIALTLSSYFTITSGINYTPDLVSDRVEVRIEYLSVDKDYAYCKIISGMENPPRGEGKLVLPKYFDMKALKEGSILTLNSVNIEAKEYVHIDEETEEKSLVLSTFTTKCKFTLSAGSVEKVENGNPTLSETLRNSLSKVSMENLPDETRGVIFALLTGDKYGIDYDLYSSYRVSGVAHVLAVSGLHVTFLMSFISWILSKTKLKKIYTVFIIIPLLFLFNALCDFTPSVVRASVMSGIHVIAPVVTDRRYDSLSAMSLSGVILLLFNPLNVFSYGFILSFVCVFGVIALTKPIADKLKFLPKWLASTSAMSISASLAVLPLSCAFFGELSLLSILTNVLVVPVLSLVYGVLFVVAVICSILNFMGFLLTVVGSVVYYLNFATQVVSEISFASVKISAPIWFVAGYYVTGIGLTDYVFLSKNAKRGLFVVFIGLVISWIITAL